jgi:serine/threonine protein kinase, bacterial
MRQVSRVYGRGGASRILQGPRVNVDLTSPHRVNCIPIFWRETTMTTELPPAGWYQDPNGGSGQVYWDGQRWDAEISPTPTAAAAPPAPTSSGGIGRRTKVALIVGAVAVIAVATALAIPALLKHRSASSSARPGVRSYGAQIVLPFTGIDHPQGIAADNAGNLYVASLYNSKIFKLAAGAASPTAVAFDGLNLPNSVAVDSAGNLYVTNISRMLFKLAPGASSPTVLLQNLKAPLSVTVDNAGTVYVVEQNIPDREADYTVRVLKLPPGSGVPAPLPFTGLGTVSDSEGLAVDGGGNLYVTDGKNQRILKLAPGASSPTVLSFNGICPSSAAVDSTGDLYFVDGKNAQVYEMLAGTTNPVRLPFSDLRHPAGVAVDGAGNVYVADEGADSAGDRVVKLPVK